MPLTAHFGIVHGEAVGMMLPHVVRFNERRSRRPSKLYAELASAPEIACVSERPWKKPSERSDHHLNSLSAPTRRSAAIPSLIRRHPIAHDPDHLADEASKQWNRQLQPKASGSPRVSTLRSPAFKTPESIERFRAWKTRNAIKAFSNVGTGAVRSLQELRVGRIEQKVELVQCSQSLGSPDVSTE